MLARRHMQSHVIATMDHDPIRADIDPTLFRIAGNHQIVGADVTAAVELMPTRHGKLEQIDVAALLNIFEQRRAFNFARLDGLDSFYLACATAERNRTR